MITKVIISKLRNDSTLQTLLGASDANSTPVFTTHNFEDTVDKQINVGLMYGETIPFDQTTKKTNDGRLHIYVLVKDTVSEPIETLHDITSRVITLLDLKGPAFDSTIHWIQKIDTDFTHYDDLHFFENDITFRFVETDN